MIPALVLALTLGFAWWDSEKGRIVRDHPVRWDSYPDWWSIDCGCCNGLEWGSDAPRECANCLGSGQWSVHLPTRTRALYPGGPLLGAKATEDELRDLL